MLKNYFSTKITEKHASDTGMAIVLIFLIIAMLTENFMLVTIASIMLIINMAFPKFYLPFAILWLGFSNIIGIIVSKIILTIIFFVLVTPVGLFRRLLGKDSLNLKGFKKSTISVMKIRNHKYSTSDLENPF